MDSAICLGLFWCVGLGSYFYFLLFTTCFPILFFLSRPSSVPEYAPFPFPLVIDKILAPNRLFRTFDSYFYFYFSLSSTFRFSFPDFLFFDCQRWIELRKGGIGRGGNILIKIWGDLVLYFVFLPYTISIALRGLTSCRSDIRVGGGYSVCRSRYSTYLHLLCTPNSSTSPAT
ncbi:hypothetical protein HOY82DRAFT_9119 [Tuber indicum]|nr:hypothetical protein HOY82DRAFT_9119 [Tuber indicum]